MFLVSVCICFVSMSVCNNRPSVPVPPCLTSDSHEINRACTHITDMVSGIDSVYWKKKHGGLVISVWIAVY